MGKQESVFATAAGKTFYSLAERQIEQTWAEPMKNVTYSEIIFTLIHTHTHANKH